MNIAKADGADEVQSLEAQLRDPITYKSWGNPGALGL